MKTVVVSALLGLALFAGGCSAEKKASELLETARFEEKQNNSEHAAKLYDEIVREYPGSAAAREAALRLNELRPHKQ